MESLLKHGFSYQVPKKQIEAAIFFIRGMDKRTCARWIEIMETLGYIIKVSDTWHNTVYEMNVVKIPNLVQILKNIPQTHLIGLTHTHKVQNGS